MPDLSIPYSCNINTDVFFISLYAKSQIFTYAPSVCIFNLSTTGYICHGLTDAFFKIEIIFVFFVKDCAFCPISLHKDGSAP